MCQHYEIKTGDKWYKHQPETVNEGENANDPLGLLSVYGSSQQNK